MIVKFGPNCEIPVKRYDVPVGTYFDLAGRIEYYRDHAEALAYRQARVAAERDFRWEVRVARSKPPNCPYVN